ncbi:MAG: hypothetical protein ACLQUY_24605 [Ktedonobacterales bacterium]
MRVRIIAALGALVGTIILVVATLSVNGTTLQSFQTLDQQARAQDKGVASTSPQPCANPRLQVSAPIRVLSVSQTEAVHTQVTNQDTVECDITLSLVAPNFTLQPADNQRLVQLGPTESSTVTWNVTPTSVGHFTLAVTAGNASEQIGITAVSGNGIIPLQPQTLDYLAIFFGFLMTVLSLVALQWWTRERRNRTPRSAATVSPPSSPTPDHQIGAQPVP